jgi:6-pyruvoyltetrahydropterin/6-carboxytetrahydropterin synthase
MFEVGATARFRAFHSMPSQPPPENELHAHEYRVEVVAERDSLDERGMVCDLDVVTTSLANAIDRARDRDLAEICEADGATVEILAGWIHAELAAPVRNDGAELLAVRVWESEDAFGGIRARL